MKHLEFNPEQRESVVFLHGGNVAGWMWGAQVPEFPDYHLLVPDLPGFGESNDIPWTSMADAADRVAEMIEANAHEGKAHVVGLSLGASVAVALAARHPQAISTLFLTSASATGPLKRETVFVGLMLRFWSRPWFWKFLARGYGLPEDARQQFIETGLGIRTETAAAIYEEVCRGIPFEQLDAIAAPTLVVAGERDSVSIAKNSLALLTSRMAGLRAAIAPGMHHQWNIENVQLFNDSLRAWLERGELYAQLRPFSPGGGDREQVLG